ncbi:MAG: spore coat associated protein CotJA [Bacillota bacterium]
MNTHDDPVNKEENVKASAFVASVKLAQAYVPWQRYGVTFSPQEALEKGTLFPELYRPYPY